MGWVKLDDGFADHPKVVALTDKAVRLHLAALCYASRHLTDGAIPYAFAASISPKRTREELVASSLWDLTESGYFIHDFLEYNPSRDEVRFRQESDRNRKGIGEESDSHMVGGTTGGEPGRVGVGEVQQAKPVTRSLFADFWAIYPRREGKRAAERAFMSALRRAEPDVILAGATRYRDDPNRDPEYTAHPSTWLNQDRWEDDPQPSRNGHKPKYDAAKATYDRAQQLKEVEDREAIGGARTRGAPRSSLPPGTA